MKYTIIYWMVYNRLLVMILSILLYISKLSFKSLNIIYAHTVFYPNIYHLDILNFKFHIKYLLWRRVKMHWQYYSQSVTECHNWWSYWGLVLIITYLSNIRYLESRNVQYQLLNINNARELYRMYCFNLNFKYLFTGNFILIIGCIIASLIS